MRFIINGLLFFCLIPSLKSQVFIADGSGNLYTINVYNCTSEFIGNTGFSLMDIAIHPQTGILYGVSSSGRLYSVDKTSASTTYIGFSENGLNALTFSSDGVLYSMGKLNDNLYTIDVTTGTATNIGSTDTGVESSGDLAFLNDTMYLAGMSNVLVQIDHIQPDNSVVFGFFNLTSVYGLMSVACDTTLYALSFDDVYALSPDNFLEPVKVCTNIIGGTIFGAAAVAEEVDIDIDLGEDIAFCNGQSILLDATTSGATYQWQDGSNSATYTITAAGVHWVNVSVGYCYDRDTIEVQTFNGDDINFGPDTSFCDGEVLLLDASIPGATYQWQNGSTDPLLIIDIPGIYWVEVTLDGCISNDTIEVNMDILPYVEIGDDFSICDSDTLTLNAVIPGATYHWQDGSTDSIFNATKIGEYWVQVDVNGCKNSDTAHVSLIAIPFIDLGNDTTICDKQSIDLGTVLNDLSYLWQNGDTDPIISATQAGTYWVQLTNDCGIYADSLKINVEDCSCNPFIPNAFSPNGDYLNDSFSPITNCYYSDYELMIFDRWGGNLFSTENPNFPWNGMSRGELMPPGVYVYYISFKDYLGKVRQFYGDVTLIR